jgi:folylpolyglutamate synthase
MTLLAFHTFLRENVYSAVIETGMGGEIDPSNIIPRPIVTGVISLGLDHVDLLEDTVEKTAWHKGGIFNADAAAWTVEQPGDALQVLSQRAEKGVVLKVADPDQSFTLLPLGLAGDHQKTNTKLAIAIAAEQLRRLSHSEIPVDIFSAPLPAEFKAGLQQVYWPGRYERREAKGCSGFSMVHITAKVPPTSHTGPQKSSGRRELQKGFLYSVSNLVVSLLACCKHL